VLAAQAENLLRGVDDLDDTIKLLQAFEEAGAHVLYAPGINSPNQLRTVTGSLDKPFNVLASFMLGEILPSLSAITSFLMQVLR
jgi:2-methylisocitrate lyase-like PEP mutase family enzyme